MGSPQQRSEGGHRIFVITFIGPLPILERRLGEKNLYPRAIGVGRQGLTGRTAGEGGAMNGGNELDGGRNRSFARTWLWHRIRNHAERGWS